MLHRKENNTMKKQRIQTSTTVLQKEISKEHVLRELRTIPGVGTSIALDLWNLGIHSKNALKNKDPEDLYQRYCDLVGHPVDRCLLYVFRCAIYYVSHRQHRPELLLWWNWKD